MLGTQPIRFDGGVVRLGAVTLVDGKAVGRIGFVTIIAAVGVSGGFGENRGRRDRRAFSVAADLRPTGNGKRRRFVAVDERKIR